MTRKSAKAATPASTKSDDTLRVAYKAGPPEITFMGMDWRRGVAQKITGYAWEMMRARPDFQQFDFQIAPDIPATKE